MNNVDERSLGIVKQWKAKGWINPAQRDASLQSLISDALIEQDKLTRDACAESVNVIDEDDYESINSALAVAVRACMNAKAT